jgi:CheY-like chemotaxis protein/HPt (histidine-containing phosphotransfer) domain-containing protein
VDGYLSKPVNHSDLLDVLSSLFGTSTRQPARRRPAASRRQLQILVAEDNAVNRKLVTAILRKRGHKVKAVEHGRAAVDAVQSAKGQPFDAIVMDLQMPELNGLDATQAIRDLETRTGARVPIVALTAHALQGDRERCLAAGMDGYLSKPVDADELIATVERFAGAGAAPDARAPAAPAKSQRNGAVDPLFNEQAALAHTGGDRQLLTQVIAVFQSGCGASLRRIRTAIRRRDGEALRQAAHAMKGPIATVGSALGRQVAAELEQMGRSGAFEQSLDAYRRLTDHVDQLEKAFAAAGLLSGGKRGHREPNPRRRR